MEALNPKNKKEPPKTKVEKALDYLMEHPVRVLIGGAVVGVGSYLLYRTIRKIITNQQQKNTEKKLDDSPEVRQASVLRNAMNPSGYSWMMSFDKTNEEKIYETAKEITKLDDVMAAYKKLYDSDLLEDLQSELDTEEYQKFLTLISSNPNKTGTAATTFASKNQMVVAKKDVYVRKTPDASYHEAWYEGSSGNNILFMAKAGEFIGYATGKQELDTENNVKFIQVGYLVKKEGLPAAFKSYAGKSYTMWVSSSSTYVDKFDYFKQMFEQYPNTKTVVAYKKPLSYYDKDVKGVPSTKVVVSIADTRVLNEKMQAYCTVEKQVLLGEFIASLNTGKAQFIKFRTVDNTERWADSRTVKIIER